MTTDRKESTQNTQKELEQDEKEFSKLYFLILLPIILYYLAFGVGFYVINEWFNYSVKSRLFPNETINSTHGCKAENHSDPNYVLMAKVQQETATWNLYNILGYSIPAIAASSILPSYSDRFGRRFLLITAASGFFLNCLISAAAIHFKMSPVFVIIGSAVDGMTGSCFSISSGVYSYIADVFGKGGRRRTIGITAFDGVMKVCTGLSGIIAGDLVVQEGYFVAIAVSCGTIAAALLLFIFIVPESLDKQLRSSRSSPFDSFKRTIEFYTSDSFKGKRGVYILLIFIFFTAELTYTHRTSLEIIYQLGMPFCWLADKVGYFSAIRYGIQGFAGLVLIVPLRAYFSDLTIAIISNIFNAGSYVLEGLAKTDTALYLVPIVATPCFLTISMTKSIMSNMTPADKQGSLFASIVTMQGVCGICATFLMNEVYSATVTIMSGFVFLVLAGVCGIVFILLLIFWAIQRHPQQEDRRMPITNLKQV